VGDEAVVAIVLGAGTGERLGTGEPKAFLEVAGRPLLSWASEAAAATPGIGSIVVTAPEGGEARARGCLDGLAVPFRVVTGGATRQASVRAALTAVPGSVQVIVVHDAARPFASAALFSRVVETVRRGADGAVPILPVADTVKRLEDGRVVATVDRDALGLAQTPQAFRAEMLRAAHDLAAEAGVVATDDAALLEETADVRAVEGEANNVKITTPADLDRANAMAAGSRDG
jgi:2-C-methyl-D-erythritol 4-phosphate cytidylyltransferase